MSRAQRIAVTLSFIVAALSGAPADTAVFELYDYEKDPWETKNLAAEQPE